MKIKEWVEVCPECGSRAIELLHYKKTHKKYNLTDEFDYYSCFDCKWNDLSKSYK